MRLPSPSSTSLAPVVTSVHAAAKLIGAPRHQVASGSPTQVSSGTPGDGTGYKGRVASLLSRLPGRPETQSHSPMAWDQFFGGHFKSADFNKGEDGKIDSARFLQQENAFLTSLSETVRGKPHIDVCFQHLPDARAAQLSPEMTVRAPRNMPQHAAVRLLRTTLRTIHDTLLEDGNQERSVHIDLGRKLIDDEAGASAPKTAGYFCLPFKAGVDAIESFGTILPQNAPDPGIWVIPGLTLSADLSGLKIEDPLEMNHLYNLIARAPIAALHIDLGLIHSNHPSETWRLLGDCIKTPRTQAERVPRPRYLRDLTQAKEAPRPRYLRDLTVTIPNLDDAGTLANALCDPQCHLQKLNLIGGCSASARATLADAVNARQEAGRPITVTIDGERLEPTAQ